MEKAVELDVGSAEATEEQWLALRAFAEAKARCLEAARVRHHALAVYQDAEDAMGKADRAMWEARHRLLTSCGPSVPYAD